MWSWPRKMPYPNLKINASKADFFDFRWKAVTFVVEGKSVGFHEGILTHCSALLPSWQYPHGSYQYDEGRCLLEKGLAMQPFFSI